MSKYVCADCGHEPDSMDTTCPSCGSVRVVLRSVIENIVGPNWRETFEPRKPYTREEATKDMAEMLSLVVKDK